MSSRTKASHKAGKPTTGKPTRIQHGKGHELPVLHFDDWKIPSMLIGFGLLNCSHTRNSTTVALTVWPDPPSVSI